MRITRVHSWMAGLTLVLLALASVSLIEMRRTVADTTDTSSCVGKPYGYPGCPLFDEAGTSSLCGNGVLDSGEQCDNGRFNDATGCVNCVQNYCGDGILAPNLGEECEPSGTEYYVQGPDGKLKSEKTFDDPPACGSYCLAPRCDETGKCYTGCKWVFRKSCEAVAPDTLVQTTSSASSSSATLVAAVSSSPVPDTCGNGSVDAGEECDDANKIMTDACTNRCTLPRCGDQIVQAGEECDDGNTYDADSCTNVCKRAHCGDGAVQPGEECDDGNQVDSDACTNACRSPRCSDGIVQIGEECDDGNRIGDDSCTNTCTLPSCGDGFIQPGEECDDGNKTAADSCSNSCKRARCGDGIRQLDEQCDDGNDNNFDSCTNACRLPVCGNGVVEGREECDDGNQSNLDMCTSLCKYARCGDGIIQPGEQCDAGPGNSDVASNACRTTCKKPVCGDQVTDQGEECDGGDYCSASCTVLAGGLRPGASSGFDPKRIALLVAGLASIVLVGLVGVYVGRPLLARMRKGKKGGKKGVESIEDIPLDQIEMPWHKW